jgi:hypothetical protein
MYLNNELSITYDHRLRRIGLSQQSQLTLASTRRIYLGEMWNLSFDIDLYTLPLSEADAQYTVWLISTSTPT